MNTAQFIKFASDITEHGKPSGYYEYVENIIEPNKNDAADYYGIRPYEVSKYADHIAHNLETLGFVVIPEELNDPLTY